MQAPPGRGGYGAPTLATGRGTVAFAINAKVPPSLSNNLNSCFQPALRYRVFPSRASAATQGVGSTARRAARRNQFLPSEGEPRTETLGFRRRRVRARGGEALLMIAQQQLDKPQAASEGAASRVAACGPEGRWREAVDMVEELRKSGVTPSHSVNSALVRVLLQSDKVLMAADALELGIAEDGRRQISVDVSLQVMKGLLGAKNHSRVIAIYRLLRVRGYIGRGGRGNARMTTMATCYGGQAAESLVAWTDAEDMYKLYLADRKAGGGGDEWDGLGESLPCVVFRTLYKAKRYEEALPYLEDALSSKKYCNTILCNMAINCLGKTKRWDEAVVVFERMSTDLAHAPDGMTHSVIINALALSGRWEEAIALFDSMVNSSDPSLRENSPAMTSSLNSAINACDISGRWQDALDLLRRADRDGVKADMISFSTTMNALVRAGKCDGALAVFREMISRKLEPGLVACNFVLTNCSKHKQGEVALEFLEVMRKAKLKITSVSYNAVITALYREEKPEKVIATFREMQLYRLCPDTFAINHCLIACDKLEAYEQAGLVVKGLWKTSTVVDDRVYTKAFSVLARGMHCKTISDLLAEMETRGIEPVEGCYTSLISAYCKAERFEEAEDFLFQLRAEGKPIRTAAFTSVISSCKQGRRWDRALSLFEEMQHAPEEDLIAPNQYTYNALISVLTFSGCLDMATIKFKEMKDAGFEYDQLTFVNMILGFARQSRYADVLVMFRGLEALTAANTQNGVWTKRQKGYWGCYNEALKGCEVEGDWEMARRLLRSMRHQTMVLDVVTYGAAIGACARAGRWKEALETLREMEAMDNVTPNVVCYSSAITACEKSGEWRKALHLLLKMINSGVEPDTIAYNASISASAKCGEWQMALKLFDSLFRAGLSPDVRTYSAAILACFKGQQWQKAMELFGRMLQDGKLPDKFTLNILVELLDSHGQHEKAVYVYETVFLTRQEPEAWDPSDGDVVDLHGYSAAVAKAAIRSGLKRLLRRFLTAEKDPAVVRDFTIITGQGKHSRRAFEPVLRPAAQDMFLEEFDPPIVSRFEPNNLGRLKVCKEELLRWCVQQSETSSRLPSPADAAHSLKLRDVADLRREYERALAEGGPQQQQQQQYQQQQQQQPQQEQEQEQGQQQEQQQKQQKQQKQQHEHPDDDEGWSGVGWTRNENEHEE